VQEVFVLLLFAFAAQLSCCLDSAPASETTKANLWNQKAAASYLDQRERSWATWRGAARDHGTFCISCHTAFPYALARPTLRAALAEQGLSVTELELLENVKKRVRLWNDVAPSYTDTGVKAEESRGTEAVLNAMILVSDDSRKEKMSSEMRTAFDNMWALQHRTGDAKGSWSWLQFDLQPWEAADSPYYGATLAMAAVGMGPANYRVTPGIQDRVQLLREYLDREYPHQSTINRVNLLWASTKFPGLLTPERRASIIKEALDKQQKDGGWRLSSLVWTWRGWSLSSLANVWIMTSVKQDGTPQQAGSDGLATAFITFVLQEAGLPPGDVRVQQGLLWLIRNQNGRGLWPSDSLNKRRSQSSDTQLFMSDAATAYAVLALTEKDRR
jgi:squalene-hopene/tetraprenyl-beta-curcumene cyclase